MKSTYPAPVACRCTVFTKSDMIHLQNKGESLPNIIAGLHFGNAANYISTIIANRELCDPIIFIGGHGFQPAPGQGFQTLFPFPHRCRPTTLRSARSAPRSRPRSKAGEMRWTFRPLYGQIPNPYTAFPGPSGWNFRLDPFRPATTVLRRGQEKGKTGRGVPGGRYRLDYDEVCADKRESRRFCTSATCRPRANRSRLLSGFCAHCRTRSGQKIKLMAIATTGSGRNVVGDFLERGPDHRRDHRPRTGSG